MNLGASRSREPCEAHYEADATRDSDRQAGLGCGTTSCGLRDSDIPWVLDEDGVGDSDEHPDENTKERKSANSSVPAVSLSTMKTGKLLSGITALTHEMADWKTIGNAAAKGKW